MVTGTAHPSSARLLPEHVPSSLVGAAQGSWRKGTDGNRGTKIFVPLSGRILCAWPDDLLTHTDGWNTDLEEKGGLQGRALPFSRCSTGKNTKEQYFATCVLRARHAPHIILCAFVPTTIANHWHVPTSTSTKKWRPFTGLLARIMAPHVCSTILRLHNTHH